MIDLHCHPSLKIYLFDKSAFSVKLNAKQKTSHGINFLPLQTNLPDMKKGGVKTAISAHYIPELGLIRESSFLKTAALVMELFWKGLIEKIETAENKQSLFNQTLLSLSIFEEYIDNARKEGEQTALAHSYDELVKFRGEDKIVFIHSVEGAHGLGRHLKNHEYVERIDQLFQKGVCMLTIGHFFDNDLVSPTEGIPPAQRAAFNKHTEKDLSKGITNAGEEVVRRMIEKGMLIDLVHSTPAARKRVLEINREYGSKMRPVLYSHCGVQALFENKKYPNDRFANPDEEEIISVQETNGAIGITFMNYWLSGKDDKPFKNDAGMKYVLDTVKYIHSVTGTYDNIAIGSDFDAVNNPSDDLFNHSFIPELKEFLNSNGISETSIEKIFTTNALRVLQEGWGSA